MLANTDDDELAIQDVRRTPALKTIQRTFEIVARCMVVIVEVYVLSVDSLISVKSCIFDRLDGTKSSCVVRKRNFSR